MNVARPNFVRYIFVIQSVFFSVGPTDIALICLALVFPMEFCSGGFLFKAQKRFQRGWIYFQGRRFIFWILYYLGN